MKLNSFIRTLFILISLFIISPPLAAAAEILVLVWERGQVQNLVLGQGNSDKSWDIYLKNNSGRTIKFRKSFSNKDNFVVYSISLPNNLPLDGYVVEARDFEGNVKQVAGIQVVAAVNKEITRVPIELFILLFGISIFIIFLTYSRGRSIEIQNLFDTQSSSKKSFNRLPSLLQINLQKDSRTSLLKTLISDGIQLDFKFSSSFFFLGLFGVMLMSYLQFRNGAWIQGDLWIIGVCLVIGNISVTYGLLMSTLSMSYLLLNISLAKSIGEILAIFTISLIFILPNLYSIFLAKLFNNGSGNKARELLAKFLSSAIAALSVYQLLLLYESLHTMKQLGGFTKELTSLAIAIMLVLKNLYTANDEVRSETFVIVRPIGPGISFLIFVFSGLTVYSWTTNRLIAIAVSLSIFFMLTMNWLKFRYPFRIKLREPNLLFMSNSIAVFIFSIFLASRALPLDVINRSHFSILLIILVDLILVIYVSLCKLSENTEPIK